MASLDGKTLDYYREFSANNLNFLADVEDDLNFEENGGSIIYAIDFSEVYGYSMGASETFFFEKGGNPFAEHVGRATLIELHEAILEHILFEQKSSYLLLPPYAVELFNFIRRLNHTTVQQVASRTIKAVRTINDLKQDAQYQDLLELARTDDVMDPQSPSNKEFRSLFLRMVPDLVELWRDRNLSRPIDKARKFLEQPFNQVTELVPEITEADSATVEYWLGALNNRRPDKPNQNFLDAQAMGFLFSLNKILFSRIKQSRVVLISRSTIIYEIMSKDLERWEDIGGSAVRHPRSFLNQISSLGTISDRKKTKEKKKNVLWWKNTFSRIAGINVLPSDKTTLTTTEWTNRSLAVLVDVWRRFCSAQVSSRVINARASTDDILLTALHALNSSGSISGILDAIITDLHRELDKVHFNIPAALNAMDELQFFKKSDNSLPKILSSVSGDEIGERVIVYNLHGTTLTYSIHIKSNKIRNVISEHSKNPYDALAALAESITYSAETDGDLFHVEWYLAMAYLYASVGAWSAAENSIGFALSNAKDFSKVRLDKRDLLITQFEISYLKSRCHRELNRSLQDRLTMADELGKYIHIFDRFRRFSGKNRYLARARTEKIKCLFEVLSVSNEDELFPRLESCVKKCRENIKNIKDPITEIQFLNNFCYHVSDQADRVSRLFSLKGVSIEFLRFVRLASDVYGSVNQWPENYVDTYCWVTFILSEGGFLDMESIGASKASIMNLARENADRKYISEHDESDFASHRWKIGEKWA